MAHAEPKDVSDRLGRPLNPGELGQVAAFLEDAEGEILRRAPDILVDVLTNAGLAKRLTSVEVAVVLRAARLPDSLDSIVPAQEGTGFSSVPNTQGAIYLRRSEWRSLGVLLSGAVKMTPDPVVTVEPGWPESSLGW